MLTSECKIENDRKQSKKMIASNANNPQSLNCSIKKRKQKTGNVATAEIGPRQHSLPLHCNLITDSSSLSALIEQQRKSPEAGEREQPLSVAGVADQSPILQ